jgi:hypothetical protein
LPAFRWADDNAVRLLEIDNSPQVGIATQYRQSGGYRVSNRISIIEIPDPAHAELRIVGQALRNFLHNSVRTEEKNPLGRKRPEENCVEA